MTDVVPVPLGAAADPEGDRPDVSICIPTWNGRDLLLACLGSIAPAVAGLPHEIIVVDNGSTDGTCDAVAAAFPEVRLLQNESNEGFPAAVNRALRVAGGKYAMVVNNDVVVADDAVKKMIGVMAANSRIGLLGCRVVFPDGRVQQTAHDEPAWQDYLFSALFLHRAWPRSRRFGRINRTYLDYGRDLVVDSDWVGGVMVIARSDAISSIGLLDERIFAFAEDWDWCRRFRESGYRVVYYGGAEVVHHHGRSSTRYTGPGRQRVRQLSVLRTTAATLYVFRKHHPADARATFLFQLCFRLHCLSRAFSFAFWSVFRPAAADWGTARGYGLSVILPYSRLADRYLRRVPSTPRGHPLPGAGAGPS